MFVRAKVSRADCIFLATAWIDLHTVEDRRVKVCAFLDQDAIRTFISESLCQTLQIKRQCADMLISCFAEIDGGCARAKVSLGLSPCNKSEPMFSLTAYVIPRVTSYAASQIRPFESWPHWSDLELADPDPANQHPIHCWSICWWDRIYYHRCLCANFPVWARRTHSWFKKPSLVGSYLVLQVWLLWTRLTSHFASQSVIPIFITQILREWGDSSKAIS
jgi:hypothetical protein